MIIENDKPISHNDLCQWVTKPMEFILVNITLKGRWATISYKNIKGRKVHKFYCFASRLSGTKDYIIEKVFEFIFRRAGK